MSFIQYKYIKHIFFLKNLKFVFDFNQILFCALIEFKKKGNLLIYF